MAAKMQLQAAAAGAAEGKKEVRAETTTAHTGLLSLLPPQHRPVDLELNGWLRLALPVVAFI